MDVTSNIGHDLLALPFLVSVKPNQPVILQPSGGGSINFLAEQGLNSRIPLVEIHILMYKAMTHYSDIKLDFVRSFEI